MSTFKPKPCKELNGWYEIPGYSRYAANRKGFILNKKLGNSTQGGVAGRYRKVSVYRDGDDKATLRYTHDLICRAFHGKPKKGQVVIHKDNDRLNIKPSNLKWGTQSENIQDMWDDGLRGSKESYQEEDTSTFTHDGVEYFLNPVLVKAHRKKAITLSIDELSWNLDNATYDEERVKKADPSYPIVVLDTPKWGYVVIDGTHRLIKASRDNHRSIGAYVLKEADIAPYKVSARSNESLLENRSLVIDEDLVWHHRYNDWVKGKNSTLWVTGFAGSGKTTYAKKLSSSNKVPYVELDALITRLVERGLRTERELIDGINKELSTYDNVIVDGIQAPFFITDQSSFLLMRNGFFESTKRAGKRRGEGVARDTFLYAKTNLSVIGEMARLKEMAKQDSDVKKELGLENLPPSANW